MGTIHLATTVLIFKKATSTEYFPTEVALKTVPVSDTVIDNNYREFVVGQCVNKFKIHSPNWIYTFCTWSYLDNDETKEKLKLVRYGMPFKWDFIKDLINKENITYSLDTNIMSHDKIEKGCLNKNLSSIVIEYLPNAISLKKYLSSDAFNIVDFVAIMFQVYAALVSVKDEFTHYDLHPENILLITLRNDTLFTYVKGDLFTNTDIVFKSKYIPVIIDYGRSYVNCVDSGSNAISAKQMTKIACSTRCNTLPNNVHDASCDLTNAGYFGTIQDKHAVHKMHDTYIDINHLNNSHDLRLIDMCFNTFKSFAPAKKTSIFKGRYSSLITQWTNLSKKARQVPEIIGAISNTTNGFNLTATSSVNNISDCLLWLTTIIKSNPEDFQMRIIEKCYGFINVHSLSDTVEPWIFIHNDAYIP